MRRLADRARMHGPVAVLLGVLLLAACGGPPPVSVADPNGNERPAGGPTSSLSAEDNGLLQILLGEGVDPGDAQLLSYTKTVVTSDAPGTAKVVERLFSGDVITFSVVVGPGGNGPAGQLHTRTVVREDGFDVHLDYVVGPEGLTDDVRKSLDGIASADHRIASVATDIVARIAAASPSFVSVSVDWSVKKVESYARDSLIKEAIKKIAPGAESTVGSVIKANLALIDGLQLGAEMDALLAELNQLEACARNPTNPLTKDEYARDPALLPGILGQIEEARNDIKANTFVMAVGVLNGVLAGAGPKWLGYAIGPGTAWSKATLKALNKELVADLHDRIPKCTPDCPYTSALSVGTAPVSGGSSSSGGGSTSSGGSSGGGIQACFMPQTIVGSLTYTVTDEFGLVWYRGDATGLVYRWDPATDHYGLVDGRLNWTVDVVAPQQGCQGSGLHYFGSGSEPLVPDGEPVMRGGDTGPSAPDESADIFVVWAVDGVNPSPATYATHGIVRIHDKDPVHVEDVCGAKDDITGYFGRIYNEYLWFELSGSDNQNPEIHDGKLAGTAKTGNGSSRFVTYQWNLEFRP